jgi:O-antigen/teichoic acid export membrane protein
MLVKVLQTIGTKGTSAILSLLIALVGSRYLGASGYGEVAILLLSVSVFTILSGLVTGSPMVFYASKASKKQLFPFAFIWIGISTSIAYGLISIISVYWLTIYQLLPVNIWQFVPLAGAISSSLLLVQNFFLGRKEYLWYNLTLVSQLVLLLAALLFLIFAINIRTVEAYMGAFLFSQFLVLLICLMKIWKIPDVKTEFNDGSFLKEVFSYGSVTQSSNIVQILNERLNYFIVSTSLSLSHLGVFSLGTQISEGLKLVARSISVIQYAQIVNSKNQQENIQLTITLLKIVLIVTLLFSGLVVIIPRSLFVMLFGGEYDQLKTVMLSLIPGIISISISLIFSHYFSGNGHPKHNLHASLFGFIVLIVFIFPLIKYFGITGAGIATSMCYFSSMLYQCYVFLKQTQLSLRQLLPEQNDLLLLKKYWDGLKFLNR